MSKDRLSRRRARQLVIEMAVRGLEPPTLQNARDLLDLIDPEAEEFELAEQVAEWASEITADTEISIYQTRALLERARGTPPRKPRRDRYARIRALRLPPEREKKVIEVANKLTAMIVENRRRRWQPQSPNGPASDHSNP